MLNILLFLVLILYNLLLPNFLSLSVLLTIIDINVFTAFQNDVHFFEFWYSFFQSLSRKLKIVSGLFYLGYYQLTSTIIRDNIS